MNPLAEAMSERPWRERCGEPARGHWPRRCRRDLAHPTPHLSYWPGRLDGDLYSWPGAGNDTPVQITGRHCWCT